MAACNDLTKREAQVLIKRKFPPRPSGCGEACVAGAQRTRGHLRCGCAATSPAGLVGPRRIFRGGRGRGLEPRWASRLTPRAWRVSRGLSERERARRQECAGAAYTILWEPPSPGDLRGHQWAQPPEAIQGRAAPGKRRGSQLANESLTKRRSEGTSTP